MVCRVSPGDNCRHTSPLGCDNFSLVGPLVVARSCHSPLGCNNFSFVGPLIRKTLVIQFRHRLAADPLIRKTLVRQFRPVLRLARTSQQPQLLLDKVVSWPRLTTTLQQPRLLLDKLVPWLTLAGNLTATPAPTRQNRLLAEVGRELTATPGSY